MFVVNISELYPVTLNFKNKPTNAELIARVKAAFALNETHTSYVLFRSLIQSALRQLRTIEDPYVLTVSSPFRFDDACGDEDWRAVQIGSYKLNNGTFFRGHPDPLHEYYLAGKLASAVMQTLEEQSWRELFRDVIGLERSNTRIPREFGLLRRDGNEYLIVADSVDGGGAIYKIKDAQDFDLIGFPYDEYEHQGKMPIDKQVDAGEILKWISVSEWANLMLNADLGKASGVKPSS